VNFNKPQTTKSLKSKPKAIRFTLKIGGEKPIWNSKSNPPQMFGFLSTKMIGNSFNSITLAKITEKLLSILIATKKECQEMQVVITFSGVILLSENTYRLLKIGRA